MIWKDICRLDPGTVEEMSHQTNLSTRKFLTMVADCRSDLLKAARKDRRS